MRVIPEALQAKLDAGVTTLCTCWRIDRRRGAPLGFTDHDRDLGFDGVLFEAASGFEASSIEHSLGLSIDNMTAKGALRSDRISEADIARGRFDGAVVQQWLVDWTDPSLRVLRFRGEIGEIRRGDMGFEVELRGLSEVLNRSVMRQYLPVCDAVLGDMACRVDLSGSAFRGQGEIVALVDARSFVCAGLGGFTPEWFTGGRLNWIEAADDGDAVGIRQHRVSGNITSLVTARDLPSDIEVGQGFAVVAGCDKRLDTCRGKFSNIRNFRGFPYIPGESWLAAYPVDGGNHDGGTRGGR